MTSQQLLALASFFPAFEAAGFTGADMAGAARTGSGSTQMPCAADSAPVEAFVAAAYENGWILKGFD